MSPTPGESKHAPARWSTYLQTHDRVLGQWLDRGFVLDDRLEWLVAARAAILRGHLGCTGGLAVRVTKTLLVTPGDTPIAPAGPLPSDAVVQTRKYTYNVFLQGRGEVLRYDNVHRHDGHGDEHHRHLFDPITGIETLTWTGVDGWPTLGQVLDEVQGLYWEWRDLLDLGDAPPDPELYRTT